MTDGSSGPQDILDAGMDAGVEDAGIDDSDLEKDKQQISSAGRDLDGKAGSWRNKQQTTDAEQTPVHEAAGNDSSGTATEESGASGLQENGVQSKESLSESKIYHDASVKDSVMAALNLLPSWTLQNKISARDPPMYHSHELRDDVRRILRTADTAAECPFTTAELTSLARPIVEKRFLGQKKYRDKLKDLVGVEIWRDEFLSQETKDRDSGEEETLKPGVTIPEYEHLNQEYERWLDADDAPVYAKGLHLELCGRLPLLHETLYVTSAYELDFCSNNSTCGALTTISRTNINLRWMCELGDRFDIKPIFFVNLISSLRFPFFDDWPMDRDACLMDGIIAQSTQGEMEFIYRDRVARKHGLDSDLSSAFACVSCTKLVDSFFLALHRPPLLPLDERISEKAVAMPVPNGILGNMTYPFFTDAWNAQRLAKLLSRSMSSATSNNIFAWLLALSAYTKRVADLTSEFRKLDYGLTEKTSKNALGLIKDCRAKVGRLRADIATAHNILCSDNTTEYFCYERHAEEDAKAMKAMKSRPTPRQLASTSTYAEYEWIDKEAAALMPLLNTNLQILVATISLEDAAVTKKNGERSTLLTAFAAVYLPLTLATGIFGMNIREIGADSTPRWWAFISLAAGLTVFSVFCIWLFFTRDVKIEHSWQRALHRVTGGWYGDGLERKKSDEEKGGKLA